MVRHHPRSSGPGDQFSKPRRGLAALLIHGPFLSYYGVAALMTLGLILTLAAFFPGGVSHDSLEQYAQARTGRYDDWHPPVMALAWRLLLSLWDSPGILLVAHNLAYWGLWGSLACFFFQRACAKLGVALLAFLPPLWCQAQPLWKDTEFSLALLGCFLFAALERRGRTRDAGALGVRALALAFFTYAAWVRANSLPAMVPLAFYLFHSKHRPWATLGRAAVWMALVFAAGMVLNGPLLKARHSHIIQLVQIHDLAGLWIRTGDAQVIPSYWLRAGADPQKVAQAYRPDTVDPLVWGGPVPLTQDPKDLAELRSRWFWALDRHPWAYLAYRWDCFRLILGLRPGTPPEAFHPQVDPNPLGVHYQGDAAWGRALTRYFFSFTGTPLFAGWFYSVTLLCILGLTCRLGLPESWSGETALASALVALFYQWGYFFYGIGCDFRYQYAVVTLTFFSGLMACLALLERSSDPHQRRGP